MIKRKVRKIEEQSDGTYTYKVTPEADLFEDAHIITSESVEEPGNHAPVIDLDFPVTVIPSTTPGHNHLYLDRHMSTEKYYRFLEALDAAGLIEPGYMLASLERGYSAVRVPWLKKPEKSLFDE